MGPCLKARDRLGLSYGGHPLDFSNIVVRVHSLMATSHSFWCFLCMYVFSRIVLLLTGKCFVKAKCKLVLKFL